MQRESLDATLVGVPLRIGIQVNTTQRVFRWSEIRELAVVAEDVGLDSVWTEDHLFYQPRDEIIGPWEAWTILAGLAEATEKMRIGSMISPLGMRSPALLAKQAETVDEMSDGRLVLGVGLGWNEAEHQAVGSSLDGRLQRFLEGWQVLLSAFDEGHAALEGRYTTVKDFHLIPRGPRPRPELMIGSRGPKTLAAVLPHVDGWNWDGFANKPDEFAHQSEMVDEICEQVGRDPRAVYRSAHLIVRLEDAEGLPIDPLPEDLPLIHGPASRIAESLAGFVQAGADEVQLLLDPARPASIHSLAEAKSLLG